MNKSVFISLLFSFFVFSVIASSSANAQNELQDVVYLKNGSILRGTIIELIPNKSLKIKMADNSLFVFQMDEIEKITKETNPISSPSIKPSLDMQNGFVIGTNPLGAIVGGVSWISYEKYYAENFSYQIRGDLWTYSENENDRGYYYKEDQIGFGFGGSTRAYLTSSQPYSGLYGAFGLDAVFTDWNWEERETSYSNTHTGDGSTLTMILSTQIGFAIALSNIRVEPSIVAGYFLLREKGAGVAGVFVAPAVQIGVMF